jgi:hypothetical protein
MNAFTAGANWKDPQLHAYLFAFDDGTSRLQCVGSTAPADDSLRSCEIGWGRQFVGTAFRRNETILFRKKDYEGGSALFEAFPESVQQLAAIPLYGAPEPVENQPVAVLALASSVASSGLASIFSHDEALEHLDQTVTDLWDVHLNDLFPEDVPGTFPGDAGVP